MSVYTGLWSQGELFTVLIPIYDGEEFVGVVAADSSVDDIREIRLTQEVTIDTMSAFGRITSWNR